MTAARGVAPPSALARPAVRAQAQVPAAPVSGIVHSPSVPRPAGRDDVVGVMLQSDVARAARPVTFGQVFVQGDMPRGSGLGARINGQDIPAQLDVKATHPDGSARMGVVTLTAPAPAAIMLTRHAAAASGPIPDLAAAAARHNVTVDLVIEGASYHIDAAEALARAPSRADTASYWMNGTLAAETRIDVPVTGSLHVSFDIRAYADGSAVIDPQVRNDIVFRPDGKTLTYDVTIRQGKDVVVRREKLRHFLYQTWHWPVWSAGEPHVTVAHDPGYMMRAGAVHHYDLTTGVAGAAITAMTSTMGGPEFDILGSGGITKYMPTTGGRGDIGPLTAANTIWLLTQHPDAARYALAQADAAGSVPWHLFDRETGDWVTVTKYPRLWNDGRAIKDAMTLVTPVPDPDSGWAPDTAHVPDLAYVPYIMTGSRYYLDQLNAEVSGTMANIWPYGRQDGKAIVTNNVEQVRSRAWVLRLVNECAWINSDGSPMKTYCEVSTRNSLAFLLEETRRLNKGEAHGWFTGNAATPTGGVTAPWQQDFVANTLILMARQGVPVAKDILRWQTNFLVGRFLAENRGLPPRHATAYGMVTFATRDDEPLPTWAEVESWTIKAGYAKDAALWASDDSLYNQAALGVLGGIVTVLGSAESKRALAWMRENGPHLRPADFQANPTWNIVPGP